MRNSNNDRARNLEQDTQTAQRAKVPPKLELKSWDIRLCLTGYQFNLSFLAKLIDSHWNEY
jgi:hypothetical protein